jgi:hypothetical protein
MKYSKEPQHSVNWISFHPLVKKWEAPALLGPLENANFSHWGTEISVTTSMYARVFIRFAFGWC